MIPLRVGLFHVDRPWVKLQIRREQPCGAVAQAERKAAALDFFPFQAARLADTFRHQLTHALRELAVVAFDVELEVEPEASRVPIRRAEQDPVVVDDHELAVIERCFRSKPDADAVSEHLGDLAPHGPGNEVEVSLLGDHDVDVETAQRGGVEGVDQRLIGKEVRRDDADRLRRARGSVDEDCSRETSTCASFVANPDLTYFRAVNVWRRERSLD